MKLCVGTEIELNWHVRAGLIAAVVGLTAACPVRAGDLPEGLSDPTSPSMGPVTTEAAEYHSGPVLQSTFISSGSRRAIISGRSYRVGDQVGGAVIMEIQAYEVILKQGARETHLRLLPKLTKEAQASHSGKDRQEGGNK